MPKKPEQDNPFEEVIESLSFAGIEEPQASFKNFDKPPIIEISHPEALRIRLIEVLRNVPWGFSKEVATAILKGQIESSHAIEFYKSLTEEQMLDLMNQSQLRELIISLYSLSELVIIDPQNTFSQNVESQNRLYCSMRDAITFLENWLSDLPMREDKYINARDYLMIHVKFYRDRLIPLSMAQFPEAVPALRSALVDILRAFAVVPNDLLTQRRYLNLIARNIYLCTPTNPDLESGIEIDKETLKGVVSMLRNLDNRIKK